MLNFSSQGTTLNFIAWKKKFLFVFIVIWLHTDKIFVWKDASASNVDIFKKEQFSPRFFV